MLPAKHAREIVKFARFVAVMLMVHGFVVVTSVPSEFVVVRCEVAAKVWVMVAAVWVELVVGP